jgi:Ca2+-binding RTX toxin-like protein
MTWLYPQSISTTGNTLALDLGEFDNGFVGSKVYLASQGTYAAIGFGSEQTLVVRGSIAGAEGVQLGDNKLDDHGSKLEVSETGEIFGQSVGAAFFQFEYQLDNAGSIEGGEYGIYGAGLKGHTSLISNSGKIISEQLGINIVGDGTSRITNNGLIHSDEFAVKTEDGREQVINRGQIVGDVSLGAGNDVYDGRHGSVSGVVDGGSGVDKLYGGAEANSLHGGDGNDIISGGAGADDLFGEGGKDMFLFKFSADSTIAAKGRDNIHDFNHADHDLINLRSIDANANTSGNQAFTFIHGHAFAGHAGELQQFTGQDGEHLIRGDTTGDGKADFAIELDASFSLSKSDFLL